MDLSLKALRRVGSAPRGRGQIVVSSCSQRLAALGPGLIPTPLRGRIQKTRANRPVEEYASEAALSERETISTRYKVRSSK